MEGRDDNMRVRQYRNDEKADVQRICIANSKSFANGRHDILLLLFCDYYLEHERESCFVLANAHDKAAGYIICAPDWNRYETLYIKEFMPLLEQRSPEHSQDRTDELLFLGELAHLYPAHLHMDVLKDYQSSGYGGLLMQTLAEHLQSMQIPGVMLEVGGGNIRAHRFYERHGFVLLEKRGGSCYYGRRLADT